MYRLDFTREARKKLDLIKRRDFRLYGRFVHALERIALDPSVGKALRGSHWGTSSYRLGDYRIIYRVIKDIVTVVVIDLVHRRETV